MKKLIFLPLLLICMASFGQRVKVPITFTVPVGDDSTSSYRWYSYENSWSTEINSTNVTGIDTLYVYGTASVDSGSYALIWVDQDLDGVNDNPFSLSPAVNFSLNGIFWPWEWIVFRLAKGAGVAGETHYGTLTKK